MNKHAIMHQSDSRFSFPVSETAAVIRLRTARFDDIREVNLIWNTMHKFYLQREVAPMSVRYSDDLFDYYECTIDNGYPGYTYIFQIVADDGVWYYNESGLDREIHFSTTFQDKFNVVFPNEKDIIVPNKQFQGRVFYQIFPERFNKSTEKKYTSYINMQWNTDEPKNDVFAGGDLGGITEKLDYLADLGIGAVYMTPIHPSVSAHKYDIDDYFDIDKMFGDLGDLKKLVTEAHKRDIKIVLDLVFNHSSFYNPMFQDVVTNGRKSKYYDWYFVDGDKPDWKKLNYKSFCDVRMMPKLNTNNPEVQEYLTTVGEFYLRDYDVDGFRLDVAFDVSHDFWRFFKHRLVAINPDVFLIGEDWQNSESFLGNDQWDSVMNYPFLYACQRFFAPNARYDSHKFVDFLNNTLVRYKDGLNHNMLNLLDSHDIERFFTTVEEDKDVFILAVAALMFYQGCPMLYYGDEVFLNGKHDPYNRKCMRWDSPEFEGLGHQAIKKLVSYRKLDALKFGDISISTQDEVVKFTRSYNGEKVILLLNHSNTPKRITAKTGYSYRVEDGFMQPNSFAIIQKS
jgi:glycosidase